MSALDPLAALSARVAAAQAAMLEAAIDLGVSAELLQVRVGDILPAKVLAPQQGQDFIEILGKPLAAQLPPGVHPGETLLLQVTGFSAAQMFVRNLGAPDPQNPLPVSDAVLRPAAAPPDRSAKPSAAGEPAPLQPQSTPPVSPPRAVFVAASVRQAAQAAASAAAPSGATPVSVPRVEARIAAAQAAAAATPGAAPALEPQPQSPMQPPPMIPARSAQAPVLARAAKTVSEFLRAARLPDTPFTRMAATIAPHAPERLPSVLQRLEAALPRAAQDARVATLRTLVAFTARFNPAHVETLRAQISAYVSNAVQGAEAKLQQLLVAHTEAQAQPERAAGAQARAAERAAAVTHDLKSVVLSLLRDPPADRTPAMSQALSETLMTLTGVQIDTLSSNQQNPGTFSLTLPVYYHEGGKPAQIRIARDADSRAAKMDADNFHVAFVLDTAHLGTVAIDLQTTGRTVKVDVKTETATAAERFSDTLASLRGRLEDLRYRVASAAAGAVRNGAPRALQHAAAPKQSGVDLQA